jgi:hypothetical protein
MNGLTSLTQVGWGANSFDFGWQPKLACRGEKVNREMGSIIGE